MNWFTRQIEERRKRDDAGLEEAFRELRSAVTGLPGPDETVSGSQSLSAALSAILRFYRIRARAEVSGEEVSEALGGALEPHGILWRAVTFRRGWYRDAVGPFLCRRKSDGSYVVFLPGALYGYVYLDPASGARIPLSRRNEAEFESSGFCFYRGFPARPLVLRDLLHFILRVISPSGYILMAGLALLVTLIGMLTPRITYLLFTTVLESGSARVLIAAGIFSLCTASALAVLRLIQTTAAELLNTELGTAVDAAAMARIISLPPAFFKDYSAGELSNRVNAMNTLCGQIISGVYSLSLTSLFSVLYISQIFRYTPALVIPSLLITALTVGHLLMASFIGVRITEEQMEASAKLDGFTYGLLGGIQKIRLSGSEKRVLTRWLHPFARKIRLLYRLPFLMRYSTEITLAISLAGELILYYLAVRSGVGFAEYNAFSSAYGMMSAAFMTLTGIAATIAQIRPVLNLARPIMEAEPEYSGAAAEEADLGGAVELSHVNFRYAPNEPWVIRDFSLKIKPGQHVAIVGKTGCGKSTLVRLLLGFNSPERGSVYYGGRDLREFDIRTLRKNIGTVLQDGKLMSADIFSNIRISAPQATLDDAWEAAEIAGLADDIRAMPMGMDTMITEGSGGISGGQKQRLMIARAIVGHPKILIFDEATSALDNLTQKRVTDALCSLKCTRIVIAHRLSTIRHCDRILFLEDGRIAEDGTYEELIALNGRFAELVERQRLE